MPTPKAGPLTSSTGSSQLSGTTPPALPEQKGSLRGSEVSLASPSKQLPETDIHSSLNTTAKPILSRRAKIIKAITSFFKRCSNAVETILLSIRLKRQKSEPSIYWNKNDDHVTITTNIQHPEDDLAKSASNIQIAPRISYKKEEQLPHFEKVAFKKAATKDEDDTVELLRATADDGTANPKNKRTRAKEKVKDIAALARSRYFGKTYPKTGLPSDLLQKYHNPALIIVKGFGENPAGHAVLGFESPKGERFYTQINNLHGFPEHMTEEQCAKYIDTESGGILLEYRPPLKASTPKETTQNMQAKLNSYSKERWPWGVTLHNCYSYCLHILDAGGYDTEELRGLGLARLPITAINVAQRHNSPPPED